MMLLFDVNMENVATIRLACSRYDVPTEEPIRVVPLILAAVNEASALRIAMREVILAIDADPATYATTTMKLVRSIAAKALSGEPTEA